MREHTQEYVCSMLNAIDNLEKVPDFISRPRGILLSLLASHLHKRCGLLQRMHVNEVSLLQVNAKD